MHTDFSKKEVTISKSYHFAHSLSISMRVFTHALNMFTLSSSKFERCGVVFGTPDIT